MLIYTIAHFTIKWKANERGNYRFAQHRIEWGRKRRKEKRLTNGKRFHFFFFLFSFVLVYRKCRTYIFIIQSGFIRVSIFRRKKSNLSKKKVKETCSFHWSIIEFVLKPFSIKKTGKNNKWSQTMFVRVCVHKNRLASDQCIVIDGCFSLVVSTNIG